MYCNIFVKINTDLSLLSLTYLPKWTLLPMIDNKKVFLLIKLLFYSKMIKKCDKTRLRILECTPLLCWKKRNNVSECVARSQLLISHLNLSISLWNLEPVRYRSEQTPEYQYFKMWNKLLKLNLTCFECIANA